MLRLIKLHIQMKKRYVHSVFASLFFIFIIGEIGCKRNEVEPTVSDFGYDYYPIDLGTTWEYQVDSIQFKPFDSRIDTFQFMVKHIVVDTFIDATGVKSSIINVYHSDSIGGSYKLNRSVTKRVFDYRAEVTDTNFKVISLVFPPNKLKYWDANAFNTNPTLEYEIIDNLETETIGSNEYNDVVHVVQQDEDFRTIKNYGIEKYSKHFGMIYARQISWTKERLNDTAEIPDGYDYTYTLKSFKR